MWWTQFRGEIPHPIFLLFAVIDVFFFVILLRFLWDTRAARSALAGWVVGEPMS